MSDQGRYRKLYPRLWRHPGFCGLSEGEKVLALYLITGPQTNRLGLYCLSVATAAEDLGTVPETLKKRLGKVCQTFGWLFDGRSRVVYIPSWFTWNPPENVNVMKGSLKDLNEIPPSGLVDAFARNLETLSPTLHETFAEGLRQRLPKGMPNQEQYPEAVSESGKQEPSALRAATPLRGSRKKEGFEKNTNGNGDQSEVPAQFVAIARQTLVLTNPKGPLADLADAFLEVSRRSGLDCSKADAVAALNVALAERRATA